MITTRPSFGPPLAIAATLAAILLTPVALDAFRSARAAPALRSQAAPIPPPVLDNWAKLIGTWVADNGDYKSADDPYDAFGLDWSWGVGQKSLIGRLYGIRDDRDVATFWQFREYWHPGEARLVPMQFSAAGAVGIGWHELLPDGRSEMLQTFFNPVAGTVERIGHRSRLEGDRHVTAAFQVDENGEWTPGRSYTWIRQPAGG